jgi:two-component system sensor histidine kinase CpxA
MSLFLKIFLWFWLAMALVVTALVASVVTTQERSVLARWHEAIGGAHALHAQTAVEVYENGNVAALSAYLNRAERATHINGYVFDADGKELLGRGVPAEVQAIVVKAAARKPGETEWSFARSGVTGAHSVESKSGRRYVVVGEMPRARFGLLAAEPRAQLLRLLVVVFTAGFVCYALAHYLSSPVGKLREATRRLAGGDLSARVGKGVGKRRGDELAGLARDFDVMAERIESLVGAQKRLLGDISHELRSPLARLGVALELAREKSDGEIEGELNRIGLEAERLNDLIRQLLNLVRMEDRGERTTTELVDLEQLLREVVSDADFEARAHARSVRIIASVPCSLNGSRMALRSAIENIVRNAVRYTAPASQVEIALHCDRDGKDGGSAVVTVRDHGTGVPEESLGDLFRPFYRVDDSRERRTGGAGLGLAIAERAVRMHGGEMKASNADGGGLMVELRIPLEKS